MQQSQEAPGQPGISYRHGHLAVGAEQMRAEAPALVPNNLHHGHAYSDVASS